MATQVSSAIAEMTARALPGTSTMLWSGTQRTRCCSVPRFSENTRPIAIFASTRPLALPSRSIEPRVCGKSARGAECIDFGNGILGRRIDVYGFPEVAKCRNRYDHCCSNGTVAEVKRAPLRRHSDCPRLRIRRSGARGILVTIKNKMG
jgi:hypothetical protein